MESGERLLKVRSGAGHAVGFVVERVVVLAVLVVRASSVVMLAVVADSVLWSPVVSSSCQAGLAGGRVSRSRPVPPVRAAVQRGATRARSCGCV